MSFLHNYPYVLGIFKLVFYKLFMGKNLEMHGKQRLSFKASFRTRKNSKIILQDHAHFAEGTLLRVTDNAIFKLGKNSGFNSYCVITCRDKIIIGDNVMFGPFVTIHDHDHIFDTDNNINEEGYKTAPIIIEDNVWIGGNVVILKGVTIGTGSVVAAGAIVTKDVPPYSVVYNKRNVVIKKLK
ncbi:succinyltransferase-like protein [Faecalimonas umbilicata]|uniref:Succinyltransferase-like protein n=1 Tax=Faecalimonas umbilicata TaxID=1912855 RepID=A0A4V2UQB1_9FIRM|nr:acyltransferase [Faecalimonas umbilicata]TCS69648.1 succinyltransferase-like protein [Faecalimonas umbilicata]GBU05937.1 hypothetical protein FAEUMB_24780 [Faecalimonas umbilicata]